MAFTPDGGALWTVARGSIEIRSWPDLELIAAIPSAVSTRGLQSLAFHPAGRMAALASGGGVRFLAMDARPLERPVHEFRLEEPPMAIAFGEDGRLLVAGTSGLSAMSPDGAREPIGTPPASLPSWIWKAAILPASGRIVYCANDHPALVYRWTDGGMQRDDEWAPGLFEDDHTSWLGADVAPGERALVCGRKSGRTWAVHLRAGLPVKTVMLEKAQVARSTVFKRPTRTTAHAIHPTEDAVVFAEISGSVGHSRLSTGERVRELPSHSGGYAWE